MEIKCNKRWEDRKIKPFFTILTPSYNRAKTIERTIWSIEKQIFRDFEYIIVDDGSTDQTEDICLSFMKQTGIPVMYIKKENGGVHTARNTGCKHARGTLLVCIDSDDELTPNCLQTFFDAWKSIPDEHKHEYREIVGRCINEKGEELGMPFPEKINEIPWNEAIIECQKTHGEHLGCDVTRIRQENLFLEPEGVTFVQEGTLWYKLFSMYKSFFINDVVRIYHTEGCDHISKIKNLSIQDCRNIYWQYGYYLSNWDLYGKYFIFYKIAIRHEIVFHILHRRNDFIIKLYKPIIPRYVVIFFILYYPTLLVSLFSKRCKVTA